MKGSPRDSCRWQTLAHRLAEQLQVVFLGVVLDAGTTPDTLHVCDAVECKLPAEDWFDSQKKVQKKL